MRAGASALLCMLCACTCETDLSELSFLCVNDGDCVSGWTCVDGLCAQSADAGTDGGSGGGNAGGAGGAGGGAGGAGGGAANGAACTGDNDCASRSCVRQVCCQSSCGGACSDCSTGNCIAAALGAVGVPPCAPFLCNGTALTCPAACRSAAECAAPLLCNSSGACVSSAVPLPMTPPSVTADGGALIGSDGTWGANGGGTIFLTRRWLRCASDAGSCVTITTQANLSGANLQTDATRATGISGDGLPADSGVGTWSATTNLCLNGGLEANTNTWGMWTNSGTAANLPVISRTTAERRFGAAALSVTTNGVESTQSGLFISPASAQTPYTASGWIKAPGGARLCVYVDEFDSANMFIGSFSNSASFTADGGWNRLAVAGTSRAATAKVHVLFATCTAVAQAITFFVDGAQLERGPMPSPYVETNGAQATRAASTLAGPASLLRLEQGWAAFRMRPRWSAATARQDFPTLLEHAESTNNKVNLYYYRVGGNWGFERNLTRQNTASTPHPASSGTSATVVATWTPTQLGVGVNDGGFGRVASSELPVNLPATIDFAALDGELLWVALGAGRLDDGQAGALNAFGDADPQFDQLPGQPTMLWPADTLAYRVAITGPTYSPGPADVGALIVLEVTATNANGSTTRTSGGYGPIP